MAAQESDLVRVLAEGQDTLVLMANAVDGPFASCWPAGSRLLLDLFETEWAGTRGDVGARLGAAFQGVGRRFIETALVLDAKRANDDDDSPLGSLLALVRTAFGWQAAWIGGDVALLVRRGEVKASTPPHTLLEHLRAKNPNTAVDPRVIPAVIARNLGGRGEREMTPSIMELAWERGDSLVVMNWSLHRGDVGALHAAAKEAARYASAASLAERLVENAWSSDRPAYAAAAVVRFEE